MIHDTKRTVWRYFPRADTRTTAEHVTNKAPRIPTEFPQPSGAYSEAARGAYAYYVTGRYDDAAKYFDRAVTLMPESPFPLYMRGWAKAKMGNQREADADLAEAARLKPDIAAAMAKSGWK